MFCHMDMLYGGFAFLEKFFIIFFPCKYFPCMRVCTLLACMVPTETRRGPQNPWDCCIDGCELPCGFWEPNLGSLEEHQTLLTTEPSLEPR